MNEKTRKSKTRLLERRRLRQGRRAKPEPIGSPFSVKVPTVK